MTFPTSTEVLVERGVPFVIRILGSIEKKHENTEQGKNPFLPYDSNLFVADISQSHVCILNKFNVVDHHVLLVTKEYESQCKLLNLKDFEALWAALEEIDGLAFYNGGKEAGASQEHKHIQIAPFPFSSKVSGLPVSPWFKKVASTESIACVPNLPFIHSVTCLQFSNQDHILNKAKKTYMLYREILLQHGCHPDTNEEQSFPYNLLMTRDWMLFVPRRKESCQGISVNSLGFAGSLLVKNKSQLDFIKATGLLQVLKEVAIEK